MLVFLRANNNRVKWKDKPNILNHEIKKKEVLVSFLVINLIIIHLYGQLLTVNVFTIFSTLLHKCLKPKM